MSPPVTEPAILLIFIGASARRQTRAAGPGSRAWIVKNFATLVCQQASELSSYSIQGNDTLLPDDTRTYDAFDRTSCKNGN